MNTHLWPDHRIQKLLERQEALDPNLKNLNIISNNLHYFVGLLATDGNIHSKNHVCRLMLSNIDTNLLEQIQNIYGGKLYKSQKYPRVELSISYRPFISYLNSIGITPNKTFTLDMATYFNSLAEQEKWHFIRGCIDGDGSFSFFKTKQYYRGTFSLCGASRSFMKMISEFMGSDAHFREKDEFYTISSNGTKIEKLLSRVYELDNDSLFLDRKYKKYLQIIEYHRQDNSNPCNRVDEKIILEAVEFCKGNLLCEASAKYGVTEYTLRSWCTKNNIQWYKPPKKQTHIASRPREYSLEYKLNVIEYRKNHKNVECMLKFNIGKTTCSRWKRELRCK